MYTADAADVVDAACGVSLRESLSAKFCEESGVSYNAKSTSVPYVNRFQYKTCIKIPFIQPLFSLLSSTAH
jgi:hypothetical protein